jgi:PPE-repeat protein
MLEFAAIPPEINSGRMYAGPGSGPMLAASTAWDYLADDLYASAVAYGSTIADLTSSWLGPSSLSMAAAAATYVSWINATAAQAEQTAAQAKAAAAAYEAAFAMTVPPAVIAANRALLLALVATNFFGQNTPAIMATEADYVEMWAQDAVAMYGYAGASSAASTLTPFATPMETTNSSGLAAAGTQAAATSAGTGAQTVSPLSSAAMPSALQALASTMTSSSSATPLSSLTTSTSSSGVLASGTSLVSGTASSASMLTSGLSTLGSSASLGKAFGSASSAFGSGFQMFKSSLDIGVSPGAGAWGSPEVGGVTVTAASGRAASLGALSVPQGWTSAAPAFSQVASALPAGGGLPATTPATPGTPAGPIGPAAANASERGSASSPLAARYYFRPAMVQRPVYAG